MRNFVLDINHPGFEDLRTVPSGGKRRALNILSLPLAETLQVSSQPASIQQGVSGRVGVSQEAQPYSISYEVLTATNMATSKMDALMGLPQQRRALGLPDDILVECIDSLESFIPPSYAFNLPLPRQYSRGLPATVTIYPAGNSLTYRAVLLCKVSIEVVGHTLCGKRYRVTLQEQPNPTAPVDGGITPVPVGFNYVTTFLGNRAQFPLRVIRETPGTYDLYVKLDSVDGSLRAGEGYDDYLGYVKIPAGQTYGLVNFTTYQSAPINDRVATLRVVDTQFCVGGTFGAQTCDILN